MSTAIPLSRERWARLRRHIAEDTQLEELFPYTRNEAERFLDQQQHEANEFVQRAARAVRERHFETDDPWSKAR